MSERIAAVLDRLEAQQQITPLASTVRALELLQKVYRGEYKATPQQMRAATEALAFESPKLQAIAHFSGNFAEQLDQAIERRSMKVITHEPVPVPEVKPVPTETHAPDEMKGNFPKLRRRF